MNSSKKLTKLYKCPNTDLKIPGDGVNERVGLADAPEVDGVTGADQALVDGVDDLQ